MHRPILATGMIVLSLSMMPLNQRVPNAPEIERAPLVVASLDGVYRSKTEALMGLDAGSQQPTSALLDPIARATNTAPAPDFSTAFHTLTDKMMVLPPEDQAAVTWLASTMIPSDAELVRPKQNAMLVDHLAVLADAMGKISDADRQVVLNLAETLANE